MDDNQSINTVGKRVKGMARIILLALFTTHCSDSTPIRLGFVGGLSGAGSDFGVSARNGALLAIEEANTDGGIQGHPIEMIVKDDRHDKARVRAVVKELIGENVAAIIGPTTSDMGIASVELANTAKVLMMGVTVTTSDLSQKDDFFMRGLSATSHHALAMAEYIYQQRKIDSFSAIIDAANSTYSVSWINEFSRHFKRLGGRKIDIHRFHSGTYDSLPVLARQIAQTQPGIVVLVTNAVDAALLAKLLRSEVTNMALALSEWAATGRLIELGGVHVEQAIVSHHYDPESKHPAYVSFRQRFIQRFNQEPDFPGIAAYNVTMAILTGLKTRDTTRSLRDELLATGTFNGLQGPLTFDEFGDSHNRGIVTEIENGCFVLRKGQ